MNFSPGVGVLTRVLKLDSCTTAKGSLLPIGLFGVSISPGKLLLALFGAGKFLNDLTAFPVFNLLARIFHEFCETTGQFVNAPRLPSLNRLVGNQFGADADGSRARQNEVGGSLLIHASGRDQGNL